MVGLRLLTLLVAPRALTDTAVDLQQTSSLTQTGQYAQAGQLCLSILLNQRHTDFQSIRPRASSAFTRVYKRFFGIKRGLQVVYKWTSK